MPRQFSESIESRELEILYPGDVNISSRQHGFSYGSDFLRESSPSESSDSTETTPTLNGLDTPQSDGTTASTTPLTFPPEGLSVQCLREGLSGQEGLSVQDNFTLSETDLVNRQLISGGLESLSSLGTAVPGQRIIEYEKALLNVRVLGHPAMVPAPDSQVSFFDLPNEVIISILSHTDVQTRHAMALVCRHLYGLVTTPDSWRLSFRNHFFPNTIREDHHVDVKMTKCYFSPLLRNPTWRSEYLWRYHLMTNLHRGKPSKFAPVQKTRTHKMAAVVTYGPRLRQVTNMHALFATEGAAGDGLSALSRPLAVHGNAETGEASLFNPSTGAIQATYGPIAMANFQTRVPFSVEVTEEDVLTEGPVSLKDSMDVSAKHGVVVGNGYAGGVARYKSSETMEAGYVLGTDMDGVGGEELPELGLPEIPRMKSGISSVWITKNTEFALAAPERIGILTGSTLGVLSAYALPTGSVMNALEEIDYCESIARWVVCPGIPIVAISVDEQYSRRRQSMKRIWAVVLNALGEVYYLTSYPASFSAVRSEDGPEMFCQKAWQTGFSMPWTLLASTKRVARSAPLTDVQLPFLPADASREEWIRWVEAWMNMKPKTVNQHLLGWNLGRKMLVDFAGEQRGSLAGESIVVIDARMSSTSIQRYTRRSVEVSSLDTSEVAVHERCARESRTGEWSVAMAVHDLLFEANTKITSVALDQSQLVTEFLRQGDTHGSSWTSSSVVAGSSLSEPVKGTAEIGHGARFFGVGTNTGTIVLWNIRDADDSILQPIRHVETGSVAVTALCLSSLYLVHGGADGSVKAWDVLDSTQEPIQVLNEARTIDGQGEPVTAICMDTDATKLNGVVAIGGAIRYWSYGSTPSGRKNRRLKKAADVNGRRRRHHHHHHQAMDAQSAAVQREMHEQEKELRFREKQQAEERARMARRFGVGVLDLTDEEAVSYAQMVSLEQRAREEERAVNEALAAVIAAGSAGVMDTNTQSVAGPSVEKVDIDEDMLLALSLSEGLEATSATLETDHVRSDGAAPSPASAPDRKDTGPVVTTHGDHRSGTRDKRRGETEWELGRVDKGKGMIVERGVGFGNALERGVGDEHGQEEHSEKEDRGKEESIMVENSVEKEDEEFVRQMEMALRQSFLESEGRAGGASSRGVEEEMDAIPERDWPQEWEQQREQERHWERARVEDELDTFRLEYVVHYKDKERGRRRRDGEGRELDDGKVESAYEDAFSMDEEARRRQEEEDFALALRLSQE